MEEDTKQAQNGPSNRSRGVLVLHDENVLGGGVLPVASGCVRDKSEKHRRDDFGFSDQRRLDPVAMVKSLVFQIAQRVAAVRDLVFQLDVKEVDTLKDLGTAWSMLGKCLVDGCAGSEVIVLLDALDEAQDSGATVEVHPRASSPRRPRASTARTYCIAPGVLRKWTPIDSLLGRR